jgi:hypothetical protein
MIFPNVLPCSDVFFKFRNGKKKFKNDGKSDSGETEAENSPKSWKVTYRTRKPGTTTQKIITTEEQSVWEVLHTV